VRHPVAVCVWGGGLRASPATAAASHQQQQQQSQQQQAQQQQQQQQQGGSKGVCGFGVLKVQGLNLNQCLIELDS
jgi:hypothetical protein